MIPNANTVVFRNVEAYKWMGQRFSDAIDRLTMGMMLPEDSDTFMEMVESVLPPNVIVFPNEINVHYDDDGKLMFVAQVLDINESV